MIRIGIDLDDVLAEFIHELVIFYNLTYQTSFKREDFKSYNLWETWGGTKQRSIGIVYDFFESQYHTRIKPVKGSKKGVRILKDHHDLFVITSRSKDFHQQTIDWIGAYFSKMFSDIILTGQYSRKGSKTTKREVCERLNINYMIEDSLENSLDCADPERSVFLLDAPWNQRANLPEDIKRVYSWTEIEEAFSCNS